MWFFSIVCTGFAWLPVGALANPSVYLPAWHADAERELHSTSVHVLEAYSAKQKFVLNQTITDIADVVQQAGIVIAVLQASGVPASQQKSQYISLVRFAEQADLAAWRAAAETNSKDSPYEKNENIDKLLKSIKRPDFSKIANPSERGALESLASSIDLLRGRLEGNRKAMQAKPEIGDVVPRSIPAAVTGKLQKIRTEASHGTAAAQALIDSLEPVISH